MGTTKEKFEVFLFVYFFFNALNIKNTVNPREILQSSSSQHLKTKRNILVWPFIYEFVKGFLKC